MTQRKSPDVKPKASEKKTRCWTSYEPTPGKKPGTKGSCKKKTK